MESAVLSFTESEAGSPWSESRVDISLPEHLFKPARTPKVAKGYYDAFEVDKGEILRYLESRGHKEVRGKKFKWFMNVYPVESSTLGLAPPGTDVILTFTRLPGLSQTREELHYTVLHELGHKLGLVPDGTKGRGGVDQSLSLLDRGEHYYAGSGHQGNHCHKGVPSAANYRGSEGAECVMFGQSCEATGFCEDCATALRKAAWPGWSLHPLPGKRW